MTRVVPPSVRRGVGVAVGGAILVLASSMTTLAASPDPAPSVPPAESPPVGSPPAVVGFPTFRDVMTPAWDLLDELRPAIAGQRDEGLARIALDGPAVADALETGLDSVLPDICYLDAWRLEWLVAVDLRLVADLWAGGHELYAAEARERLVADLAVADEALATIGCD